MKAMAEFQAGVHSWLMDCLGGKIAADQIERNYRFLEEALEVVQSGGCTKEDAYKLVDYVYGRPVGELQQEVGGAMVTLAALCTAAGVSLEHCAINELERCIANKEKIRAKHHAKPIQHIQNEE